MDEPKRKRGRPRGSKNRQPSNLPDAPSLTVGAAVDPPSPSAPPGQTQRAALEADRDRLLASIGDAGKQQCGACLRGGDPKVEAALQSQLNGVHRMLLRITGESAPADANLIRSPQWQRLKAKIFGVLEKHPAAWAELLRIETEET